MGLAGPKKRRKIGIDPNNTTWSRADSNYGQRIMSAQGWTPGSYLGAKNASHAAHFSSANAAPIQIVPKDDNRGLGSQNGAVENGNFGLRSLHDLYGRLNGKSEDARKIEQSHMADVNLKLYADRKWGSLTFVKGGLLVGDTVYSSLVESHPGSLASSPPTSTKDVLNGREQPSQVEGDGYIKSEEDQLDRETIATLSGVEKSNLSKSKSKMSNKKKERRKSREKLSSHDIDIDKTENISVDDEFGLRKQTRQERRERKEQKRQRKAEKRARKDEEDQKQDFLERSEAKSELSSSNESSVQAAPNAVKSALGARHAIRQRFIKQKKLSSMDPKALREILMVKS